MMIRYSLLGLLLLLTGCTGSPYRVGNNMPELKPLGMVGNALVGLNGADEVVLRHKRNAVSEVSRLQHQISEQVRRMEIAHEELRLCRRESADPRLGGLKPPQPLPDLPTLEPQIEKEKWALTSDSELLLVTDTYLMDEISRLRRDKNNVDSVLIAVDSLRQQCYEEYGQLRVRKGLPFNRIPAEGRFVNGNWKMIQAGEQTLDDAFRLTAGE